MPYVRHKQDKSRIVLVGDDFREKDHPDWELIPEEELKPKQSTTSKRRKKSSDDDVIGKVL